MAESQEDGCLPEGAGRFLQFVGIQAWVCVGILAIRAIGAQLVAACLPRYFISCMRLIGRIFIHGVIRPSRGEDLHLSSLTSPAQLEEQDEDADDGQKHQEADQNQQRYTPAGYRAPTSRRADNFISACCHAVDCSAID